MIEESKNRETDSANTSLARSTTDQLPSSATNLEESRPPIVDSRASSSVTLHEVNNLPSKTKKAEMVGTTSFQMDSVPVRNIINN